MSKVCSVCNRKPVAGKSIIRRGMAKSKGGAGRKITGTSQRFFRPNIQRIKAVTAHGVRFVNVCVRCLKAGKVKKAT